MLWFIIDEILGVKVIVGNERYLNCKSVIEYVLDDEVEVIFRSL